jgi:hypothetical protein
LKIDKRNNLERLVFFVMLLIAEAIALRSERTYTNVLPLMLAHNNQHKHQKQIIEVHDFGTDRNHIKMLFNSSNSVPKKQSNHYLLKPYIRTYVL